MWASYAKSDGTYVCSERTSEPITGTRPTAGVSRSVTLATKCDASATKVALSVRLKGTGTVLVDDVDFTAHG